MFITRCAIWIGERSLVTWTNSALVIQVRSSGYQRWLVNFFALLSWCNWWNWGPEELVCSSTNAIMLLEGHAEERQKLYGLQQPVNLSFFWVIIFHNCTTGIASFPLNFIAFFKVLVIRVKLEWKWHLQSWFITKCDENFVKFLALRELEDS